MVVLFTGDGLHINRAAQGQPCLEPTSFNHGTGCHMHQLLTCEKNPAVGEVCLCGMELVPRLPELLLVHAPALGGKEVVSVGKCGEMTQCPASGKSQADHTPFGFYVAFLSWHLEVCSFVWLMFSCQGSDATCHSIWKALHALDCRVQPSAVREFAHMANWHRRRRRLATLGKVAYHWTTGLLTFRVSSKIILDFGVG